VTPTATWVVRGKKFTRVSTALVLSRAHLSFSHFLRVFPDTALRGLAQRFCAASEVEWGMSSYLVDPKHTGQAPVRRPPDSEPERIGEGELDDGPPRDHDFGKRNDPSEDDEDLLESD